MPAIARLPQAVLALDPKRIAATSVAIAVHAVVLLMLLMPTQVADPPKVLDSEMILVDTKPVLPEVKPPPRIERPRPITHQTPPAQRPEPVQILNDDPSPVDPFVESVTLDEQPVDFVEVDPQPTFAQIQADLSPPPPYPAQALRLRQAGRVVLRVRVDANGRAAEIAVESSSGFRVLDEAAIKAVRNRWHFVPANQDGRPVQAWALVPIVFELTR
jgi:periplasmic protein TonB